MRELPPGLTIDEIGHGRDEVYHLITRIDDGELYTNNPGSLSHILYLLDTILNEAKKERQA